MQGLFQVKMQRVYMNHSVSLMTALVRIFPLVYAQQQIIQYLMPVLDLQQYYWNSI
jgi:hypothetical protein